MRWRDQAENGPLWWRDDDLWGTCFGPRNMRWGSTWGPREVRTEGGHWLRRLGWRGPGGRGPLASTTWMDREN
jgi:hypothetical protein